MHQLTLNGKLLDLTTQHSHVYIQCKHKQLVQLSRVASQDYRSSFHFTKILSNPKEKRQPVCLIVPELATGSFNFVWQSKLTYMACHVSSFMMVDASSVRQTCSVLKDMFVLLLIAMDVVLVGPIRFRMYNTYTTVTMDLSQKTTPLPGAAPSESGGFPQ